MRTLSSFYDRFMGAVNTVELAVIRKRKWTSPKYPIGFLPRTTALLAYNGRKKNLGQDCNIRFVLKISYNMMFVDYFPCSEEGVMNFQIALGKYQNALEEFRARGTPEEHVIRVEVGGFQSWKWTAESDDGETLYLVLEIDPHGDGFGWAFSEESAKNLQRALDKYQAVLAALRSTGKVPGWL